MYCEKDNWSEITEEQRPVELSIRFLFLDAINFITDSEKRRKLILKDHAEFLNFCLCEYFKEKTFVVLELQELAQSFFVAIQQQPNRQWSLLFDGRQMNRSANSGWPVKTLQFNCYGQLLLAGNGNVAQLPLMKFEDYKKHGKQEPLWQLLNLKVPESDPQSKEDLLEFLGRHNLLLETEVDFFVSPRTPQFWHTTSKPKLFRLSAYTKFDYSIAYRKQEVAKKIVRKRKIEDIFNEFSKLTTSSDCKKAVFDAYQQNRSSVVSVSLSGLTEAFNLGAITNFEHFKQLSYRLSLTSASIWVELDESGEARYITYSEINPDYTVGFEVNNHCELSWKKTFDEIFERRQNAVDKKQKLLGNLIQHLSKFPSKTSSPWTKCINSLKACIKRMTIVLFSEKDDVMHALKLNFANYLSNRKEKYYRGVTIKSSSTKDLIALVTHQMCIFNLQGYLPEGDFLPSDVKPKPVIPKNVKNLYHCKSPLKETSMIQYCFERGEKLSKSVLINWFEFGKKFVDQFEFDIFSLSYTSLSSLSFKCIWLKYTKEAGHLFHGIEKTKLQYEAVIRDHSHGGFSYSFRDKLDSGQEMHGGLGGGEPVVAAMEFDIMSSYGFGASSIETATGFCTGFKHDCGEYLQKTDLTARQKSFEFLSVYYTVWNTMENEGLKISATYSNFHQLGFVQIGPYPLDLVIVLEGGRILLYQFDGQVSDLSFVMT